jgi:hypothetical protein
MPLETADSHLEAIERVYRSLQLRHPAFEGLLIGRQLLTPAIK